MPGRGRTLADVHQEVTRGMHQLKDLRTWLRDEEAASSNPATPTGHRPLAIFAGDLYPLGHGLAVWQLPVWPRVGTGVAVRVATGGSPGLLPRPPRRDRRR